MEKTKKFMSYMNKVIYYTILDGNIVYMVAKGDGTDEYFETLDKAMEYIKKAKKK